MKTLKIVAVAAVVAIIGTLALELRQANYELRLQREASTNWRDLADFQSSTHAQIMLRDREEIARLQARATNTVAAH
jgi:hypothetical protein